MITDNTNIGHILYFAANSPVNSVNQPLIKNTAEIFNCSISASKYISNKVTYKAPFTFKEFSAIVLNSKDKKLLVYTRNIGLVAALVTLVAGYLAYRADREEDLADQTGKDSKRRKRLLLATIGLTAFIVAWLCVGYWAGLKRKKQYLETLQKITSKEELQTKVRGYLSDLKWQRNTHKFAELAKKKLLEIAPKITSAALVFDTKTIVYINRPSGTQ